MKRPIQAYVKLIDNKEPAFEHFAGKELTYEEMVLKLKECGILICPEEYDITEAGLKVKNPETVKRAVEDIVMACRYYSVRSHDMNKLLDKDVIAVKTKPNPEFDRYFFDDEEKDWTDFVWYPNKATIGKVIINEEQQIDIQQSVEETKPHLHLLLEKTLKVTSPESYEEIIEDDFSSTFLINLRNFVRLLGLVNVP